MWKDLISLRFLPPVLVSLLFLTSCEIINPSEELPVYFKIDQASMLIDSVNGVSTSVGLKDIWISQGEGVQGVYPLPATVPVIMKNGTNFRLDPGIYETGQSSYRITYPFLRPIYFDTNPEPGDTVVLSPVFNYMSDQDLNILVDERFENADMNLIPFVTSANDTVNIRKTTSNVFMGDYSGYVHFDFDHRYLSVRNNSPDPMFLEKNKDIYAEITYKTDIPFTVGLAYKSSGGAEYGFTPVVTITPNTEWNTVFVHLTMQIRANNVPNVVYSLWISADGLNESGDLYLDNLRLIQFK